MFVDEEIQLALDIPDAKRRLPHWRPKQRLLFVGVNLDSRRQKASASLAQAEEGQPPATPAHSRRQKASASLAHFGGGFLSARREHSRRQKASASLALELALRPVRRLLIPDAKRRLPHWSPGCSPRRRTSSAIPDAKRRLPHWSAPYGYHLAKKTMILDAKRRLPHWSVFAEVDLDGRDCHSRRQKASASLEGRACRRLCSARLRIPDAERRLPHWRLGMCRMMPGLVVFQTPKGVCLRFPRVGGDRLRMNTRRRGCRLVPPSGLAARRFLRAA